MLSHVTKKPKFDDHPKGATGDQLKRQAPRQGADAVKQKQCEGAKRTGNTRIGKKKKESVTTDLTEIKRNIQQHYDQLYTNKLDSLDEMDKF